MLCEMQSVSSRIWTRVAESISCEDNHYTTGHFIHIWFVLYRGKEKIYSEIELIVY